MKDTRKPTRMYCDICGHLHKIDFWVPDEIWDACIKPSLKKAKVCLNCFMERADEQCLYWELEIKFMPHSFASMIDIQDKQIVTFNAPKTWQPLPYPPKD